MTDPKTNETIVKTVVTACDHNFLWGAILLGLSLRFHKVACHFHVLGYDLSEQDIQLLQNIPDTKVFSTHKTDTRSVCTQKPMAIATANTELIIWMDADCIVTGNVDKYLYCPEGRFQIRFRDLPENAGVYRNFYRSEDKFGEIPKQVLRQWQMDIADLQDPQIKTVSQTNCFVLNRTHLPFIRFWQNQMEKVIPEDTSGVYAKNSIAYSMTDESVINSLFAYSSAAPEVTEYLLDKDSKAYCAHFGLMPKPWQHFTVQSLHYYEQIQVLLHWAKAIGIALPPIPLAFISSNRWKEIIRAHISAIYKKNRYKLSTKIRKILRHLH